MRYLSQKLLLSINYSISKVGRIKKLVKKKQKLDKLWLHVQNTLMY